MARMLRRQLLMFGCSFVILLVMWPRASVWLLVLIFIIGFVGVTVIYIFGRLLKAAIGFVVSGEWEGHAREFMDALAPQVRLSTMIAQRFQTQMIAREIEKELRKDG